MDFLGDIRLSIRALLKSPGFVAVAVATLALGIGVNATVFTVTNAALFRGFAHVYRNDRLVYISNGGCCVSYPDFEDYRAESTSFQSMAIVHGISIAFSDGNGFPQRAEVTEISAATFKVVEAQPILGRDFTTADEADGAPQTAILSYGFWEQRYAKDPAVIGRTVRKNGAPMTIVGVMPQGFSFPQTVDLWTPLMKTPAVMKRDNRGTWCVVARLVDGATVEGARAEIETIARRLAAAYPDTNKDFRPVVGPFREFFIGPNATLIYSSMWGAVGFVLLIACANLANLLLARAMGRAREISVRIALGAGRWRIIRQLLIESVMLSGLGGLLGWWLAKWGVRSYQLAMAAKESWLILDYTMDAQVLGYLIAVSVGTGLLFGLAPALRLSAPDVNARLKDAGHRATAGVRGKHLSSLLVSGEMALAIVLLAGAGVMIRSFLKIHSASMGVNAENVLVGSVDLPASRYPRMEDKIGFYDRVTARLQGVPGVESVATADNIPSWGSAKIGYEIAGDALTDHAHRPKISALKTSPSYFRTLGAQILTGREFTVADNASAPPVAIVNQIAAMKFWPGEDPLGRRLRLFDADAPEPWLTVVGVVSNIDQNDQTRQRFDPVIYLPYRQQPGGEQWIFMRTRGRSSALANAFRRELQAADADLPLYGPFDMADRLERYWDNRFYGTLFLIFAGIALLLASVGMYTVIAHSVTQRTQEIGIRMAVGADAADVLKLVLIEGMLPLAAGLVAGLGASFAINRLLESMLVAVSPSDPVSLAAAAATLCIAALLGCLIPARRALRIDPVIALRAE